LQSHRDFGDDAIVGFKKILRKKNRRMSFLVINKLRCWHQFASSDLIAIGMQIAFRFP
jgi:hypothetical protein